MPFPQHLNLVPPLIQAGKYQELLETGQTLKSALSPANNSLVVYLSNVVRSNSRVSRLQVIFTSFLCRKLDFSRLPFPKNNHFIFLALILSHLLQDAWYV